MSKGKKKKGKSRPDRSQSKKSRSQLAKSQPYKQQPEVPEAFWLQMKASLGKEFPAFHEAMEKKPPISLRINPGRRLPDFPEAHFSIEKPIPWCKEGYFLKERPAFIRDPMIHAGAYYVQEASSMLIARWIDFSNDLKILDLCAAPGGKSTLIAAGMSPASLLVSNEIVGGRARILEQNISRWGNSNVVVSHNRPEDFSGLSGFFDVVVIDAPCSGEGMFRKDPDVTCHWSPSAIEDCARRQKEILKSVAGCIKPGGRLIYSTCTYNPKENEEIIAWLLEETRGAFEPITWEAPTIWGLSKGQLNDQPMQGTWHCYPHKFEGEGFFLACLQRTDQPLGDFGETEVIYSSRKVKSGKGKKGGKEKSEEWSQRNEGKTRKPSVISSLEKLSAKNFLAQPEHYEWEVEEETLLALPIVVAETMRELMGCLRVFKAGIRVGKFAKGQLIPDHDLAMSGKVNPNVNRIELDYEQAIRYLKRDEVDLSEAQSKIPKTSPWALATYKGLALGWFKVLENRVNNHLPKELRIRADIKGWFEES